MFLHSAIRSVKADTGYDSKKIIDLNLQFPEASRYNAVRKGALIRELRARLSALPGVAGVTSARPPQDVSLRPPALTLDGQLSERQRQ